jgi:hypothetical protein
MLVQEPADPKGPCRSFVLLMLLCVGAALSAQTVHFHSASEPVGSAHCTLCEVGEAPLAVSIVSAVTPNHPVEAVEIATPVVTLQFIDGLNLSVRAPPLSK